MLLERPDISKLLGMTGCLQSMVVILTIIMNGAPPHLQ
jgi:hypothetical protein